MPARVKETWNIDFSLSRPPSRGQKGPCDCSICRLVRYKEDNLENDENIALPRRVRDDENEDESVDSKRQELQTGETGDDSEAKTFDDCPSTKPSSDDGVEESADPSCEDASAKSDAKEVSES